MYILTRYGIESKLVRDPLYNFIEIPTEFLPIIDHKLFQRLRWISQLPLEQLVYPSAQHSRFEHSLGVMHLAILSAISLINNSPEVLDKVFKQDGEFKKLKKAEKLKSFILIAGLSGLLHDIGHAPFSHTLEEACKYSKIKYKYDHEEVGYILSSKLLEELGISDKLFCERTLKILNKKLKIINKDLFPIDFIMRKLIDGPIDVDKGDYIYRDSYHCGTTYGIYDIQRLWRNIIINSNDYSIAVNEKGALEAWTLRIQRFKMYKNVYKHHIRNITDSMLIDIISTMLDKSSKKKLDLIPIQKAVDEINNGDNLNHFVFWSDNSILKEISNSKDSIKHRIEDFQKRDLYKRGFTVDLSEYPGAIEKLKNKKDYALHLEFKDLKNKLAENKQLFFDFLIEKDIIPPVFENEVQIDIKVKDSENNLITLAQFLNIQRPKEIEENKRKENGASREEKLNPNEKYILHIYIKKSNKGNKDQIHSEVLKVLEELTTKNIIKP